MKQKTRIASKLFAALVVLTLISCCFLGTTFARYTSTSTAGSATIDVAKWDIFTPEAAEGENGSVSYQVGDDTISVPASMLSPDDSAYSEVVNKNWMSYSGFVASYVEDYQQEYLEKAYKATDSDFDTWLTAAKEAYWNEYKIDNSIDDDTDKDDTIAAFFTEDEEPDTIGFVSVLEDAYNAGANVTRAHTSDLMLVAIIENHGDVDALLTNLSKDSLTSTFYADVDEEIKGEHDNSAIDNLFTFTFYTSDTYGEDYTTESDEVAEYVSDVNIPAQSGVLYVYATVTWTTADTDRTGVAGDEFDTWVGENVEYLKWNISYTAVQASELPTTP